MIRQLVKPFRKWSERRRFQRSSRAEVFDWIFHTNKWGCDESRSGKGSDMVQSARLREALPSLWQDLGVQSVLDLPCGDLNWMQTLDLSPYRYIGGDIVEELISANRQAHPELSFALLDVCESELPTVDFMLCRDLLVHLSFEDISLAVRNIKASSITYLGCTTFTEIIENENKLTGNHRRLNMQKAPFHWGEPVNMVPDGAVGEPLRLGKHIGVWRVADLP